MSKLEEYECLKNIYTRMIMLTAITPIAILFFGPFLLLYILIPNLYIYSKYYKIDSNSVFEIHIKEMLKKCLISLSILVISLLPILSILFTNNETSESGAAYLTLMFTIVSLLAGLFISWFYYLYNLVKASKNLDKSMFTEKVVK